jgi:hypothetical protein
MSEVILDPAAGVTAARDSSGAPNVGKGGFSQALHEARQMLERHLDNGGALFDGLQALEKKIDSRSVFDARELLRFQIQAQNLGLHVELASKVADSGLAAVRRLQSGG